MLNISRATNHGPAQPGRETRPVQASTSDETLRKIGWEEGSRILRNLVCARGFPNTVAGNSRPFCAALELKPNSFRARCSGWRALSEEHVRILRLAGLDRENSLRPFDRDPAKAMRYTDQTHYRQGNLVPYGEPGSPRYALNRGVEMIYPNRREAIRDTGCTLPQVLGRIGENSSGFRVTEDLAQRWNAKNPDWPIGFHDPVDFEARRFAEMFSPLPPSPGPSRDVPGKTAATKTESSEAGPIAPGLPEKKPGAFAPRLEPEHRPVQASTSDETLRKIGWEEGSRILKNLVCARGFPNTVASNSRPFCAALELKPNSFQKISVGMRGLSEEHVRILRDAGLDRENSLRPFDRDPARAKRNADQMRYMQGNLVPYGEPGSPRYDLNQGVEMIYPNRMEAIRDTGHTLPQVLGRIGENSSGFRVTEDLAQRWNAKNPNWPIGSHDPVDFEARRFAEMFSPLPPSPGPSQAKRQRTKTESSEAGPVAPGLPEKKPGASPPWSVNSREALSPLPAAQPRLASPHPADTELDIKNTDPFFGYNPPTP